MVALLHIPVLPVDPRNILRAHNVAHLSGLHARYGMGHSFLIIPAKISALTVGYTLLDTIRGAGRILSDCLLRRGCSSAALDK